MEEILKTNHEVIKEFVLLEQRIRDLEQSKPELTLTENALLESEAMDGILWVDLQGRLLEVNDTYCRMSGYRKEELLAMSMHDLDATKTADDMALGIQRLMEKGEYRLETQNRRKDGTIYDVEVSAQYRPVDGGRIVAFFRGITERKQIEKELSEHRNILQAVMDGVPEPVFVKDRESRMVMVNSATVAASGRPVEQILGKDSLELHGNCKTARTIMENDRRVMESGQIFVVEEILPTAEGLRTFQSTKAPYRDAAGNVVGVIGVSRDITEMKLASEELEMYRRRLEEIVKERTEELENKSIALQELNTALKVLLQKRDEDNKAMEERFLMNVQTLILPYIEQVKKGSLDARQQANLDIIEAHLLEITTPLLKSIRQFNLTPKEIKVAMLVRQGKSTKEIEETLGIAGGSIGVHRKNIRKKLGLSNRAINLVSHLDSLSK